MFVRSKDKIQVVFNLSDLNIFFVEQCGCFGDEVFDAVNTFFGSAWVFIDLCFIDNNKKSCFDPFVKRAIKVVHHDHGAVQKTEDGSDDFSEEYAFACAGASMKNEGRLCFSAFLDDIG